jgi:hypothetical protein
MYDKSLRDPPDNKPINALGQPLKLESSGKAHQKREMQNYITLPQMKKPIWVYFGLIP